MELSIDVIKILILVSLLVMTFFFGIIPVILIRYIEKASNSQSKTLDEEQQRKKTFSKYWRLLSFLNCFAAGVFLATCLLELLPSVRQNLMKILLLQKVYTGFPLAEFVMVCGLFFILIIEQVALSVKENSTSSETHPKKRTESDIRQPLLSNQEDQTEDELRRARLDSVHSDHFLGGIRDEPDEPEPIMDEELIDIDNNRQNGITPVPSTNSIIRDTPARDYDSTYLRNPQPSHAREHKKSKSPSGHNLHVHSVFRSMFLLFALSLHAVFEGLTVGLQTETSFVLSVFGALVVHKSILSFSLGMNLMQSKISVKSAIKSVILFAIAAPIGLVIGMLIIDLWDSTKSGVVHGILQGFASGTFVYIIFFEILPKEFNSKQDRLLKVLFLIIGYGVITGIMFVGDDAKHPLCVIDDSRFHP